MAPCPCVRGAVTLCTTLPCCRHREVLPDRSCGRALVTSPDACLTTTRATVTFARQRTSDGAGASGHSTRSAMARHRKGMQVFVGPKSGRRGGRSQASSSRTTRRGLRDLRAVVARDNGATVDALHHELNFTAFDLQVLHDSFLPGN